MGNPILRDCRLWSCKCHCDSVHSERKKAKRWEEVIILFAFDLCSTWCSWAVRRAQHRLPQGWVGHTVLRLLHQSLQLPGASTKVRWSCQGLMTACLRKDTGRMGKSSNRALAILKYHLEAAPTASSHPASWGYTTHLTCAFGTVPLLLLQGVKLRMGNSWSSDLCDSRQLCLCLMIPVW